MHLNFGYSGDSGPAISALLSYPNAVRLDNAGNIYIADGGNYLIRRIDTAGNITTIAGNVAAALFRPPARPRQMIAAKVARH